VTRKELIAELRNRGVNRIFNRPLSYCTREELEYALQTISEGSAFAHLSFSQIALYQKCPRQFYYRYVRGLKIPPAGATVVGRACHRAVEHDLKTALEKGTHESWSVLEDIYNLEFKALEKEAEWDEEKPEEAHKSGKEVLKKYAIEILPAISPAAVEEVFEIHLPTLSANLKGVIDLVDAEENAVIDHKVAKRKFSDDKLRSAQLTIYAMTKSLPRAGFNVLVRTKKPQVQVLRKEVTLEDYYRTLGDILHVADCIYKLAFPPTQQDSWVCSPKWCGYWDICRKELEEEVKELLPEELALLGIK